MANNKNQTPVEWIVGYLRKFNCIEDNLSTRKAIDKSLQMEFNINEQRIRNIIKLKDKILHEFQKYNEQLVKTESISDKEYMDMTRAISGCVMIIEHIFKEK